MDDIVVLQMTRSTYNEIVKRYNYYEKNKISSRNYYHRNKDPSTRQYNKSGIPVPLQASVIGIYEPTTCSQNVNPPIQLEIINQ